MTKKHYFVLRHIEPVEIDAQYSFYVNNNTLPVSEVQNASDLECALRSVPSRTKITELTTKQKEPNTFSFLDESKKEHQCVITMVSQDTQHELPGKTDTHCFWCHHPFPTQPLGCPIQYVPHRIVKDYYSEITKDNYTLRENITDDQLHKNRGHFERQGMNLLGRDYYVVDGMFCSFNCCLAFIRHHQNDPLYRHSESLLSHIYVRTFGENAQPITPAPSWRILKEYGGPMSIADYRKNFYKVEYKDISNVMFPPTKFKMVGFLYEKQVKI
jgi:hypothetical protein